MNCHAADSAPAALADLIAAGLVSHEVIGIRRGSAPRPRRCGCSAG